MAIFAFLYDDAAPGPVAQLSAAVEKAYDKLSNAAGNALQTPAGQDVKRSVGIGVKIGVGVAAFMVVTSVTGAVLDTVFRRNSS